MVKIHFRALGSVKASGPKQNLFAAAHLGYDVIGKCCTGKRTAG
jgi:hypothetical protein